MSTTIVVKRHTRAEQLAADTVAALDGQDVAWTVPKRYRSIAVAAAAAEPVTDAGLVLNIMWILLAGFLVFLMQAGFALVETGFARSKSVAHTRMMNMMVFCIGAIGYWATGFAFQFGAVNLTRPATETAAEWSHGPTTLGDWRGLLSEPLIQGGQNTILGGNGFLLAGLTTNI